MSVTSLRAFLFAGALCLSMVANAASHPPAVGSVGQTTAEGDAIWQTLIQQSKSLAPMARFEMAQSVCDAGSAIGCATAGELIISGATDTFDAPKAAELFQRGCDLGNANACQGIGLMLIQGIGIANDLEKGQRAIEKSCAADNAMACANLGLMFSLGTFGAQDLKRAEAYYQRAQSLEPDNELARQGLQTSGSASFADKADAVPPFKDEPTELRGRLIEFAPHDQDKPSALPKSRELWPECNTRLIEALNSFSRKPQTRPSWDAPSAANKASVSELESIGLMLALPRAAAAPPVNATDDRRPTPSMRDCISENRSALDAVLGQTWTLAPEALGVKAAFQILQEPGEIQATPDAPQTLLLIVKSADPPQQDNPDSRLSLASKVIARYQFRCGSSDARLVFGVEFDSQSKLVGVTGFPETAATPLNNAKQLDTIAQRVACTAPAERQVWTKLSGLEAALALRFDQVQQRTP